MPVIQRYKQNNTGTFDVVVSGAELNDDALLLLANGMPVDIEMNVIDGKKITPKQRRKIFALCNDIEEHTGQPREYMRQMFKDYLVMMNGYDEFSMSDCTRRVASELIDLILTWVFQHNIPLNYRTSDLLRNDRTFLYLATINRQCVICGRTGSDLAHRYAVGKGRNRNEIDHYGNQVLALCRNHHSEQHQIGMDSFNEKYHLTDSWVDVDVRLNKMLKGQKYD